MKSKSYSPNTIEIAKVLREKYIDKIDEELLLQIIDDVRDLHMRTFMRDRNKEVTTRGWHRD